MSVFYLIAYLITYQKCGATYIKVPNIIKNEILTNELNYAKYEKKAENEEQTKIQKKRRHKIKLFTILQRLINLQLFIYSQSIYLQIFYN